jgi:selT/selW/selH-like putative selenoprotein
MEQELGVPIRVRAGAPGSFTVLLNGEQIYSKKQTGRSPDPAELIQQIRDRSGQ